jgi:hypothetical protein
MKLIIDTQHRENYGAHDWDGTGECPQYWKNKGGSIYVVENLSSAQVSKIRKGGIPTLSKLIERSDEFSQEFILDFTFVDDGATPWDDYEQPWILKYENYENGNWIATRRPTHWAKPSVESYTMTAEGGRENYSSVVLGEVA